MIMIIIATIVKTEFTWWSRQYWRKMYEIGRIINNLINCILYMDAFERYHSKDLRGVKLNELRAREPDAHGSDHLYYGDWKKNIETKSGVCACVWNRERQTIGREEGGASSTHVFVYPSLIRWRVKRFDSVSSRCRSWSIEPATMPTSKARTTHRGCLSVYTKFNWR